MKMHKRLLAGALVMLTGITMCGSPAQADEDPANLQEKILAKSDSGNPMLGFDDNGDIIYGGDPSILVDGDTVYCYVGRDTSSGEYYEMPGWLCYSTTDMENWTYHGEVFDADTISWAQDGLQAWAGQVARYGDNYYFYYCTEEPGAPGKSIGVAVADNPFGPFADIGHPLVSDTQTPEGAHTWEDIDPTVWIETDENGEEHRYLMWGNNRFFVCELNEDMISVKDQDGDPDNLSVSYHQGTDIVVGKMDGKEIYNDQVRFDDNHYFTEAPYLYRQQDEDGNYFGDYYLFFATDWREQMAYATIDEDGDLMSNDWEFGGILMEPSATANTNHMAVFNFKGHTYFVYHDGSLPHGSGYRRVACIEEITINDDGTIDPIPKTAVGLTGTVSTITDFSGAYVANEAFENTTSDSQYPITDWSTSSLTARGSAAIIVDFFQTGTEKEWEINPGKADEDNAAYVSIESNNKPGLYMAAGNQASDGSIRIVLAQDAGGTTDEANRMTFRTLEGLAGEGVTFESVYYPGYYMVSRDGGLYLVQDPGAGEATFFVSTETGVETSDVLKTTRLYTAGETLNTDDIRITVQTGDGKTDTVTEYTTNADEIDMSTTGTKQLIVSYEYNGQQLEGSVTITVVDEDYR